mgnify:CR=1 FL=1
MKVTIYVNWIEQRVMTEDEYNKEINRRVKEFCEDEDNFEDWLDANYSTLELYRIEGKQKEEVRKEFLRTTRDDEENGGFGWQCEEFTFEI